MQVKEYYSKSESGQPNQQGVPLLKSRQKVNRRYLLQVEQRYSQSRSVQPCQQSVFLLENRQLIEYEHTTIKKLMVLLTLKMNDPTIPCWKTLLVTWGILGNREYFC